MILFIVCICFFLISLLSYFTHLCYGEVDDCDQRKEEMASAHSKSLKDF